MLKKELRDKLNELGGKNIPFLFIINYDCDEGIILPLSELSSSKNIKIWFESYSDSPTLSKTNGKLSSFHKIPVSYSRYLEAFNIAIEHLQYGNSYLLNLTSKTAINTSLSLREIYEKSRAKYKIMLDKHFVCFSPETFVKIINNEIMSFPMKGTIDASIPNSEKILMSDVKEQAEHVTIVDLLRNDLSMVADQVRVKRFRYIDEIITNDKRLLQTSSEIVGKLKQNWNEELGDIFEKLLPAGSITGAPKKKTISIINEAEFDNRGFYTGVAGIYNNGELDSCVMIRFIEQQGDNLFYRSGGGITALSKPENEYNEMIDKVYLPV